MVGGKDYPFFAMHSGGAVGACSLLMIVPTAGSGDEVERKREEEEEEELGGFHTDRRSKCTSCGCLVKRPRGVVVAVLFNLQEVKGVLGLGKRLTEEFL